MSTTDHWTDHSACRNKEPELFWPPDDGPTNLPQIIRARAVCRNCPVAGECLDWAMGQGDLDGIWGGTTLQDRRDIRRAQIAATATAPNAPRKRCSSCRETKSLTEFHFRGRAGDGYESRCKSCNTADRADWSHRKAALAAS